MRAVGTIDHAPTLNAATALWLVFMQLLSLAMPKSFWQMMIRLSSVTLVHGHLLTMLPRSGTGGWRLASHFGDARGIHHRHDRRRYEGLGRGHEGDAAGHRARPIVDIAQRRDEHRPLYLDGTRAAVGVVGGHDREAAALGRELCA
jgi:hypothetical protein